MSVLGNFFRILAVSGNRAYSFIYSIQSWQVFLSAILHFQTIWCHLWIRSVQYRQRQYKTQWSKSRNKTFIRQYIPQWSKIIIRGWQNLFGFSEFYWFLNTFVLSNNRKIQFLRFWPFFVPLWATDLCSKIRWFNCLVWEFRQIPTNIPLIQHFLCMELHLEP